jgi:hypothetical protein
MLSRHDGGSRTMSLTCGRRGLKRTGHQSWPYGMWHENAISHPPRAMLDLSIRGSRWKINDIGDPLNLITVGFRQQKRLVEHPLRVPAK